MDNNRSDSGVKFEEEGWPAIAYYKEPRTPRLIELLIKYSGGLVHSQTQAIYAVMVGAGLIFLASMHIFASTANREPTPPSNDYDQGPTIIPR